MSKIKTMKKVFFGLLIVIGLVAIGYFYFFHLSSMKKINSMNAVPSNAALIIDLNDPLKQWGALTSNDIWEYLKTNPFLSSWGNSIDSINSEMQKNETLWELVAARPMVMSVHEIRKNEYDYLYIIDLQKAAKFTFIKDYIDKIVGDENDVMRRDYHGGEIIEINVKSSPTSIYLSFRENLLTISTTHTLIEQSIDQGEEPVIARDLDFIDVSKYMEDNQPKIYLQHAFFTSYLKQWFAEDEAMVFDFINSITYSGINLKMVDDHFSLSGFSSLIDTANSLVNVLYKSGNGQTDLGELAPDNTSFFMSLGFDNAKTFYSNLEDNIAASADGEKYFEDKKKLEKFLDISIEDHFLSWIDDEVGVIQLQASNNASAAEFAIALKFKSADDAKENLDFIKNQIKKKTPVKFKGIEYKGYEINFLSIKSFFKIMFGNAFSKIDKPYYTIMDNYVVFSNQPTTLGKIINSYEKGATLKNNSSFNSYLNRFEEESTLFVYVNPEQLIVDSKKFLDAASWKVLDDNSDYISCFPMIGIQLASKNELLTTQIIFEYMSPQQIDNWNSLFVTNPYLIDTVFVNQPTMEESITVNDILPDDLNDKSMTHSYDNGQVKFEVALKDGLKNGSYTEYDSLGNVIVKGRYKNDEKTGVWKYFDTEGNVVKKERF